MDCDSDPEEWTDDIRQEEEEDEEEEEEDDFEHADKKQKEGGEGEADKQPRVSKAETREILEHRQGMLTSTLIPSLQAQCILSHPMQAYLGNHPCKTNLQNQEGGGYGGAYGLSIWQMCRGISCVSLLYLDYFQA
jgi:hypothetical protein